MSPETVPKPCGTVAKHPKHSSLPSTIPRFPGWMSRPRVRKTEKYGSGTAEARMRFSKKLRAGYLDVVDDAKPVDQLQCLT